ncbi:helix-turn-helix transcriptional regulator [Spirochaetota bacterium]
MTAKSENKSGCRALLSHNMKKLRAALGLSQMALSHRANCSTTLIANIETHKRFPSATTLDKIAKALDVHVHELFMQYSPAVQKAIEISEVKEKLEQKVLAAIDDALSDMRG